MGQQQVCPDPWALLGERCLNTELRDTTTEGTTQDASHLTSTFSFSTVGNIPRLQIHSTQPSPGSSCFPKAAPPLPCSTPYPALVHCQRLRLQLEAGRRGGGFLLRAEFSQHSVCPLPMTSPSTMVFLPPSQIPYEILRTGGDVTL